MSLRDDLARAIRAVGQSSSDYDLNADVTPPAKGLRDAAVLVPIVDAPNPSVILTKRSSALKHHPGQISFPGGKLEPTDASVVAAALREADEEIALRDLDVLGTLSSHETVTGFSVTPVLGLVPADYVAKADGQEVDEIFEVPLAHVLTPGNYRVESRVWRGQPRYYFTVPWGPYYIWGATARMLRALADRMEHDADSS